MLRNIFKSCIGSRPLHARGNGLTEQCDTQKLKIINYQHTPLQVVVHLVNRYFNRTRNLFTASQNARCKIAVLFENQAVRMQVFAGIVILLTQFNLCICRDNADHALDVVHSSFSVVLRIRHRLHRVTCEIVVFLPIGINIFLNIGKNRTVDDRIHVANHSRMRNFAAISVCQRVARLQMQRQKAIVLSRIELGGILRRYRNNNRGNVSNSLKLI